MMTTNLLANAVRLLLLYLPLLALGFPTRFIESTHSSSANSFESRDIRSAKLSQTGLGLNSAGTYPRITRLSDNSLLAIYTASSGSTKTLNVVRSTNSGASFSAWGSVASGTGDIDNGFLLQVPGTANTIIAAFRNHDYAASGGYSHFRITICQSIDGGKSWKFLSQAVESSDPVKGLWEPFLRVGADGKIQLTFSWETAADDQQTYRQVSSDGGKTWSSPVNLLIHPTSQKLRDGMQGIASSNGALVMVFETNDNNGKFTIAFAVSHDDGATWGERGTVYKPASGHNAGSPQIAAVGSNGALAIIFMTDNDETVNWPNAADVKVIASDGYSNGISFSSNPVTVSSTPSHWPGIMSNGNGALAVYEKSGSVGGKALTWSSV